METCWLKACLQLVLTGFDHSILVRNFTSELGEELTQLQLSRTDSPLDPTGIKHILVTAEDTRIATRISEISLEINHPDEIELRTKNIEDLRLNLISGQQCVRDFFLCLNENMINWPDVFTGFGFEISHSTECCSCHHIYQSQTYQMYVELQVPQDNSSLKDSIEEYLNMSSLVGKFCEGDCQTLVQSQKRSTISSIAETEFLIVILTRAIETLEGFEFNRKEAISTDNVILR